MMTKEKSINFGMSYGSQVMACWNFQH